MNAAPFCRYHQVAIAGAEALTCAGDASATWRAIAADQPALIQDPTWGWIGRTPTTDLLGLANASARAPWSTIAADEGSLAFNACASKGDIVGLVETVADPRRFTPSWPGMLDAPLARALGIRHWIGAPTVAACSTGLFGLLAAADLIEDGICTRGLSGAADSSLTPLVVAGFAHLGVLCGNRHPRQHVGSGFAPAEGAGFLALRRSGTPMQNEWRLTGGVRLGDAGHETHFSDPRTLASALAALWELLPEPDLIVVHGTGTALGDAYEHAGLTAGPWRHAPRLAMKPFIGHCLGASGSVELAVAMQGPARRLWKLGLGFGGHLAAVAVECSAAH